MSRTTEELQEAIGQGIVTVPVAPWEKIPLTGEQYISLTSNAEVLTASDALVKTLPFPLSIVLLPVFSEAKMMLIDAIFTYDRAEVEAAIRAHCPEISEEYDAGLSEVEVAQRAVARAKGELDENDAA